MSTKVLETLIELETSMHRNDIRGDRARMDSLLHEEFTEIGRSGIRYTREAILAEFSKEKPLPKIHATDFALQHLASDAWLLTYRSAHESNDGELHRFTRRSSVWVSQQDQLRIIFHQGTAISDDDS